MASRLEHLEVLEHLIPAGTGIYRYNDVDFGPAPEAGAVAEAAAPAVVAASEVATIEA